MKVAVIGANGQLGADVVRVFVQRGDEVTALTHQDVEVSDPDSVANALTGCRPRLVVNTSAMHHVDKCEADPARSFAVNAVGARNVAQVCRETGAVLIHISTDYVFDGRKKTPYLETDAPLPLNVYGNSKLAGEYFVRNTLQRHFILRVSAIYGKNPCRAKGGRNFIELMLKLAKERDEVRVVDSEFLSPTPTTQIAAQIVRLADFDGYGLYHATTEGCCSWYQFAQEIFALAGIKTRLAVAAPGEFPAKVPRPSYSVLENAGLKRHNLNCFSDWRQGLREYLGFVAQQATVFESRL